MNDKGKEKDPVPERWAASTVYADRWVDPSDDVRDSGVEPFDERSTLVDYLRGFRLTMEMKEEVGNAERYVDATLDLGTSGKTRHGETIQLRSVLVHMIEEYARHCGHADLIRERIDGRIGQ